MDTHPYFLINMGDEIKDNLIQEHYIYPFWKYNAIKNFMFIPKIINMYWNNCITFPIEIIVNINILYITYAQQSVHLYNIIRCPEIECKKNWFKNFTFDMDPKIPHKYIHRKYIRHCVGKRCHVISTINDFIKCESCHGYYCVNCIRMSAKTCDKCESIIW